MQNIPPLTLDPEQKFTCIQCGNCCNVGWLAELRETELPQLKQWYPDKQFYQTHHGHHYLHLKPDRSCIFYRDDQLCQIHLDHGHAAKPYTCRLFPFHFYYDGTAVHAGVSFSCPATVHNTGEPLDRRAAEDLVAENREAILRVPKQVVFAPGQTREFSRYQDFIKGLEIIFNENLPVSKKILYGSFLLHDLTAPGAAGSADDHAGVRLDDYPRRCRELTIDRRPRDVIVSSLILSLESALKEQSLPARGWQSFMFLAGRRPITLASAKNIPLTLAMIKNRDHGIDNFPEIERFFRDSLRSNFFFNYQTVANAYVIWAVSYELIRIYSLALQASHAEDFIAKALIIVSRYYFHHSHYTQEVFFSSRIRRLFDHYARNPVFFSFLAGS